MDVWKRHAQRQRDKAALAAATEVLTGSGFEDRIRHRSKWITRMLLLSMALFALSALYAHFAYAQESVVVCTDADSEREHTAPRRQQMTVEGESGYWFRIVLMFARERNQRMFGVRRRAIVRLLCQKGDRSIWVGRSLQSLSCCGVSSTARARSASLCVEEHDAPMLPPHFDQLRALWWTRDSCVWGVAYIRNFQDRYGAWLQARFANRQDR